MKSLGLLFCAVVLVALALGARIPSYAAAADLDCADFSSQAEAQESLLPGDPYGLDGDSDGIACEDNPCPCGSSAGGGEGGAPSTPTALPPPPPPYRLDKSAARAEARRIARRFVRRDTRVDSLAFGGCRRLAARRVDCDLTARGSTARQRTTCRLRVMVRARNRHPVARLAASDCRTRSLLLLSYARAKQSMLEAANPVAGKRVALELARLNRLEFEGAAQWERPGSTHASPESCSLELFAELLPSDLVRVLVGEPACAARAPRR